MTFEGMTLITKWDARWLDMAALVASWSKDPSTQVGAVFVRDRRPLSQGWNGFPRGFSDDDRLHDRPKKYALTVHAEMNAIFNAGYIGVSLRDSTLYVDGLPVCADCAKGIIQTGVRRIVCRFEEDGRDKWMESGAAAHDMFNEAGVEYVRLESNVLGDTYRVKFPWHDALYL